MKSLFKTITFGLFVALSLGCDNSTQFDRVNAQNNYLWLASVDYAPVSKQIKHQKITEGSSTEYALITEIKADKLGRTIYFAMAVGKDIFNATTVDYDDFTFSSKFPSLDIELKPIKFSVNSNGYLSKITNPNMTLENKFTDDKLTTFSSTVIPLSSSADSQYSWSNNLVKDCFFKVEIKSEQIIQNYHYVYDDQGRLIEIEILSTDNSSTGINEEKIIMTEFNEYGDWISAEKQKDGNEIKITREIEYW